jgi:nucleoside-diphosphate-sugar epimerase
LKQAGPWHKVPTLVTGADGFIGANVVRALVAQGAEVHVLRRQPAPSSTRLRELAGVTSHVADLTDARGVAAVLAAVRPAAVFHLGAYGTSPGQTDAVQMFRTNVDGTLNLLRALEPLPPTAFVNTGSSAEYGPTSRPLRESDALRPGTLYGVTKAATTMLCAAVAASSPHQIVTLRPFHVYGPFDDPRRFIPTAIAAALRGGEIPLVSGTLRRDFVFVDDVVDAYLVAGIRGRAPSGESFNLGSGTQHTLTHIIQLLSSIARRRIKIIRGAFPPRQWDRRDWMADIARSRRLLGWRPRNNLRAGLAATLAWHQAQAPRTEDA